MPTTLKYASVYDEQNAELLTESFNDVVKTGVALRRFSTNVPSGEQDAIIREMWAVRKYVDNPQIDRRADADVTQRLQGRWRVVSLRKNGPQEKQGIYEDLRYKYLQPPGTDGEYPKSDPANPWAALDLLAYTMDEKTTPALADYAVNPVYQVVYEGVAQATVLAFCDALAARSPLIDPVFGNQSKIPGTFVIADVKNESQHDGSSIVIGTMIPAASPALPAETSNTVSPLSSDRSETLEGQTTQAPSPTVETGKVKTVVSRIGALGRWTNTSKTDTPVRVIVRQDYISENNSNVMFTMRNVTEADIEAITGVMDVTRNPPLWKPGILAVGADISVSKQINGYGLFDAHIHARSVTHYGSGGQVAYGEQSASWETTTYRLFKGKMWKVVTHYDAVEKKDTPVSAGRTAYNAHIPKSGSVFRDIGRDWYYYLAVDNVVVATADVTSGWESGNPN